MVALRVDQRAEPWDPWRAAPRAGRWAVTKDHRTAASRVERKACKRAVPWAT